MAAPLLVLGTRSFAVEVADLAADAGFQVAGFVENQERSRCAEPLEGLPVWWVDDVAELSGSHLAVAALATTKREGFVEQVASLGVRFATVVHPTARISSTTAVGKGAIVSAGVVVGARSTIGRHVILNRGVLVGHHTTLGDYATVQPGANVAGACTVGRAAFLGMGSVVLDHLSVGDGAVVGAGAVVTNDAPAAVLVVGIPARIVREGVEPR